MHGVLQLAYNGLEYLLKKKQLSSPPVQISIEPTNICNFRCSFCPQSDPGHRTANPGKMSLARCRDLLQRAIRDFYPDPRNRKVSFTHDGEPFVNEEFIGFLQEAARLQYIIKFASNAYLARREYVDTLVSSRVKFNICVDFTAEREIFERCRGFEGSYEVVLENLRYLLSKARDTGLIFVDICDISGYYIEDPEEREALFVKLKDMFQGLNSRNVQFSRRIFHNMAGAVRLPSPRSTGGGKYRLCPYPWFNMNITWNGDVVPCCRDLDSRTILGNVFEVDSLWDIWNSQQYKLLREALIAKRLQEIASCRACDLPYDDRRWRAGYVLETLKARLLRSGRR